MLEKPDLADEKICACLRDDFEIACAELEFLPLGHDANASVYRVDAEDRNAYFLKLKRGAIDEISLVIPHFLKERGLKQVVTPLKTRDGRLWAQIDDYSALLYPFIQGSSGNDIGLTNAQWVEFGVAVKKLHSVIVPTDLRVRMLQETFIPKRAISGLLRRRWRRVNSTTVPRRNSRHSGRSIATKFSIWSSRRDARSELQTQAHEFVLCHTDMHTANVLIGTDGKVWIVDWDTPMLAPKERDLLIVTGVGIGGALAPGERGEALFYSGYGATEIDRMVLAYYRYDWAVQDIGEFGAAIFVTPDAGEETLQDAAYYLKSTFVPGSVAEAARQIDDWV